MKYPAHISIEKDQFVYVRASAIIWSLSGLHNGLRFEKSSADYILFLLKKHGGKKPIILSMRDVEDVADHVFAEVGNYLKNNGKATLILIDLNQLASLRSDSIIEGSSSRDFPALASLISFSGPNYAKSDENYYFGPTPKTETLQNQAGIQKEISEIEGGILKMAIEESFIPFEEKSRPLYSTSLYASGEFDASIIISAPEKFMWISLLLTDQFRILRKQVHSNYEIRLLSVSLRGAPFAAAIALHSALNFDVIDHLGPRQRLYDYRNAESRPSGIEYIYIGDFVCGGTEIKIAQTFTKMHGSNLSHALVIGAAQEKEAYQAFNLHSLINLKSVIPTLKYEI